MDPILTKHVREPNSFTLDFYLQHNGYEALKKALTLKPDQIIEMVKASGLRGRGGAGFPTGMKWQFVDKKIEPRYIACNADESEPGTFKDHLLMERNPHLLIEGCAVGCYAIGARVAYIYIRGEFFHVQRILERAIDEAYAKGRHPGRIVSADPAARSAGHAGELRRRSESRLAPRLGRDHRSRRHDVHGVARGEPVALLPSRVVREVHPLPRGHRLAPQDPAQDRARRRTDARSRSAVEHLGEHRRQDALRLRRRRGDAGRDDAEALPSRVRGAHQGRPVHAVRRPAGAAATRSSPKCQPLSSSRRSG